MIPLSIPNFEGNEKKYVDEAVEQGWISTGGAFITQMEHQLEEFLNTEKVACVQSGTAALHLALIDAGIQPNDIVLVPPLTFIATVNPVKYQYATPVFIDCDDSFCMDSVKLKSFCDNECKFINHQLTYKNQPVKAVIVVHVFGNMADMESIMDIAKQYNLTVIEDATEALGTYYAEGKYKGKYAGTIGDYGAYSFNGNKIITTGGGGAITSNDSKKVEHIKFLSTQAKTDPHYYIHDEIGYNYRMTNLQAALGCAQLEELPTFIERKNQNYELYKQLFEGFELAILMPFRKEIHSNKWFYSLNIDRNRIHLPLKDIIEELKKRNIETRPIWGLINEQKPYLNEISYKIEKAEYYKDRIINIPCSTQITKEEIETATREIKQVLTEIAE